ncbi:hypothetical protein JW848_10440 [Candidatus Bipolaricaulota bacterium]|nr:hypothetical protein [Candidatus Bipolaricaulota bacterium]
MAAANENRPVKVERVQTGVRIERRLLKVLKAIAENHDMTLGHLIEAISLHVLEGKLPFSPEMLEKIDLIRAFYELELDAEMSHRIRE